MQISAPDQNYIQLYTMYTKTYRQTGFLRYMAKNILLIKLSRPHEIGLRAYYTNINSRPTTFAGKWQALSKRLASAKQPLRNRV
eukprot:16449360-Heterocapsa_arctica.AAC.1